MQKTNATLVLAIFWKKSHFVGNIKIICIQSDLHQKKFGIVELLQCL